MTVTKAHMSFGIKGACVVAVGVLVFLAYMCADKGRDSSGELVPVVMPAAENESLPTDVGVAPVRMDAGTTSQRTQWFEESLRAAIEQPVPLRGEARLDTYLGEEGIRGLYNRYGRQFSLKLVEALLENKLFLSGPHCDGELNVSSLSSFGHYNPAAIAEINRIGREMLGKKAFRASIQPFYDKELQRIARTWHKGHMYCRNNPEAFKAATDAYLAILERGGERRYDIGLGRRFADHLAEDRKFSWYEAHTAIRFWIRRSIDGSDTEFFAGLTAVLSTFDPEFRTAGPT